MLASIQKDIRKAGSKKKAQQLLKYFKTGPGEYGEGDVFIGLTVPQAKILAKKYRTLSLPVLKGLLRSEIHEERLIALLILGDQYAQTDVKTQEKLVKFYLQNLAYVNNWDLVDTSAAPILGAHLFKQKRTLLVKLARSSNLWERRVAIVATHYFIRQGESQETLRIAQLLLNDPEDLIHKATGWMLREMGKRVSEEKLITFLHKFATKMPRTMLRYSLERVSEADRRYFMTKKN